jgi:hypothetical protein
LRVDVRSEERIEVIAYSGYRGEETPRIILLRGERIEVIEILSRWVEESLEYRARKRFYQVRGDDRLIHKIYYDEKAMEWFYILRD